MVEPHLSIERRIWNYAELTKQCPNPSVLFYRLSHRIKKTMKRSLPIPFILL